MKAVIDDGYDGIHMQVQITYDEKLILFGDDHLKVIIIIFRNKNAV